jgi:hypothetical protein
LITVRRASFRARLGEENACTLTALGWSDDLRQPCSRSATPSARGNLD